MKRILYTSPHIPAEWIVAHGLMPVRLIPSLREGVPREGACGFSEAFFVTLKNSDNIAGYIVAGVCDQMRRGIDFHGHEIDAPAHLFHLPTTWQTRSSFQLYQQELKVLSRFLVQCGGTVPDDEHLKQILIDEEQHREAQQLCFESTPYTTFRHHLTQWHTTRTPFPAPSFFPQKKRTIALVGGPFPDVELALLDSLASYDLAIAIDGTETGFRAFPIPLDKRLLQEEPFEALCASYWEGTRSVYQRPNTPMYQWFQEQQRSYDLVGVVYLRWNWCDLWNGEIQRFSEWCDLPVVTIDLSGADAHARNKTRLEAFCEALVN